MRVANHSSWRSGISVSSCPSKTSPGGAVDREPLAFVDFLVADPDEPSPLVDLDVRGADHSGLAELARDQRRMAGATAARRQRAFSGEHAVHVVGLRLGPDEENGATVFLCPTLGEVRIERNHSCCGPRRHVEPVCDHRRLRLRLPRRTAGEERTRSARAPLGAPLPSRRITSSLASSTAMRTAAWAVRFPLRVCRIHSLPRSTVNSMSCMSR